MPSSNLTTAIRFSMIKKVTGPEENFLRGFRFSPVCTGPTQSERAPPLRVTFSVRTNIFAMLISLVAVIATPALGLELRNADARAGFASLGWSDVPDGEAVLEWNDGTGWQELYRGTDKASTVTGLDEGAYQFRLTAPDGTVSEPLTFTVEHHALSLALQFFGAGAILFVLLIALLVRPTPDTGSPS